MADAGIPVGAAVRAVRADRVVPVGVGEVRTGEIRARQVGAIDGCATQVGVGEVRVLERTEPHVRPGEIRAGKIRAIEDGALELAQAEVPSREIQWEQDVVQGATIANVRGGTGRAGRNVGG